MDAKKYVPPKKRLIGGKFVLTEAEYRKRLNQGKPVPKGAKITLGKVPAKSLKELKVRFLTDGSIEFPVYTGSEGKLKIVRKIKTKTIPEGVRLIYHQIESVKSRIGQARKIFDEVSRLHWGLEYGWKKFNSNQKKAFIEYFNGISGQLAKNPLLLKEEQKIQAIERFKTATKLLEKGNHTAASSTTRGIKNNMLDWLRKLKLQSKFLERRRKLVVDKKFEKDTRIFFAADLLTKIFRKLKGQNPNLKEITRQLSSAQKMLYATGLSKFKQAGIIIGKAAELTEKNQLKKAKEYIRDANKKILLAASSISSIYPDKLENIRKSTDIKFKQTVLENQSLLFHDMIKYWWKPKNQRKRNLILNSIEKLSLLAENLERKDVSTNISKAKKELEKNNLISSTEFFANAAINLNPSLAKELL